MPSLSARKGHVLNVTSAASMSGFRGAVGYDGSAELEVEGLAAADFAEYESAYAAGGPAAAAAQEDVDLDGDHDEL